MTEPKTESDLDKSRAALERLRMVYHKLECVEGLFEMALSTTMTEANYIELGKNFYHLQKCTDEMAEALREVFPEGIEPPAAQEFKRRWKEGE